MSNDYFYHEQIRRYLLQFNRIFSTFKWKTGKTASGLEELRTVPCLLAPGSRQVASLLRDGKENTINTVPQFATYVDSIRLVPERRQDPDYTRQLNVVERKLDEITGKYSSTRGNGYTIESYMPVPYDIIMKCDLITSNFQQKCQLMEQILILFNPMIDLQTSMNQFDWTSLSVVELTDVQWTNVSMPIQEDNLDVSSMTFNIRAWLQPPSKVKRQTIIQEIVTNIGEVGDMKEEWQGDGVLYDIESTMSQIVTSPGDLAIEIEGTSTPDVYHVKIIQEGAVDRNGDPFNWVTLLAEYDEYDPDRSQMIIIDEYTGLDNGHIRCAGTFSISDDYETMVWNINPASLPPLDATIPNIISIIDPTRDYPGKSNFKNPEKGDRYIILGEIIQGGSIWGNVLTSGQMVSKSGNIVASDNDVIEYDGKQWNVVLHARSNLDTEIWSYDLTKSDYIHFYKGQWVMTIEGRYNKGYWRLKL